MAAAMTELSTIKPTDYLQARRPWLALYNVRLRVQGPTCMEPQVELAPIQQLLPDEMILNIFSHVSAYTLGRAASTCRAWRVLSEHPKLWQQACLDAFRPCKDVTDPKACQKLLVSKYRGSWKRMFLEHPHVRYDGLYVSRNTYIRTGTAEWNSRKTVHLVAYYRYYRFFPDGTLLYRTSPQVVSKVAKSLRHRPPGGVCKREDNQFVGKYCIKGDKVFCLVVYPNSQSTEVRSRLFIRSTHPGAYDRLDLLSIVSFDKELGTETDMTAADPGEEPTDLEAGGPAGREYRRGLAPLVFVPWEQVQDSPLNLPVDKMDFYVAG